MKGKIRKTALLVLSCASILSSVGYSGWVVQPHEEYSINNNDTVSKPVAYIVGNEKVKYISIEKALSVAQSGDIVCVIPPKLPNYSYSDSASIPDQESYEISRDCEIKPGVTLVIPTDSDTFASVKDESTLNSFILSMKQDDRSRGEVTPNTYSTKASYGKFATASASKFLRVTVRIKEGVTLTNNGQLVISGYLSGGASAGAGMRGQTSHSYSQIVLEKGSKVIQGSNSASSSTEPITYCFGYIKESSSNNGSSVDFIKGKVYMPLIVLDYKGFVFLSGIEDAVQKQGCSPFNRLEVRNIESKVIFRYGSSLYGVTNIYIYQSAGLLGTVEEILHNEFKLLGNGSDALINLTDSDFSRLEAKYVSSSSKIQMSFIGGMKMGNLAFKLKMSSVSVDLSTSYGYFPIHYGMEITLDKDEGQTSATFDSTAQKIKLLPGSSFTVSDGCSFVGSDFISLSAFVDGTPGQRDDIKWNAGTYYPLKDGATFIVKGTGSVSMNNLAGVIYCDSSDQIATTGETISIKEGWNQKQSGIQFVTYYYLQLTEKKRIVPISYASKRKAFVGVNVFVDPDSSSTLYTPKFDLEINGNNNTFDAQQGIVFEDSFSSCLITPLSNISIIKKTLKNSSNAYPSLSKYALGDELSSNNNLIVCAVHSALGISSNNDGVNEFEVQSISIKSSTPKVDDEDPLYIGSDIYLTATIVDSSKAYDTSIEWSSSDTSIATVDQSGKVTGVALGDVTITATCGGKSASYITKVIKDATKIGVSDAWIEDDSGNSSKVTKEFTGTVDISGVGKVENTTWKYSGEYTANDGSTKFSLKYEPEDAQITKVVWSFSGTNYNYLMDYSGNKTSSLNDNGSYSATVKWAGYTNSDPDGVVLKCEITDTTGAVTSVSFYILHNSGVDWPCLLPTAKVLMADGTYKQAGLIRTGDKVISFNHETGRFEPNLVIGNDHLNVPAQNYNVVHLAFSNDKSTDFINEHGYFDKTLNRYVYLHADDYLEYVGHDFVFYENGSVTTAKLTGGSVSEMFTTLVGPATANHLNFVVDDMLNISGGLNGLFNIFEYDPDTLAFDKDKMNADIEEYGLLGYERFEKYFPREIYDLLPCKYLGVSIGKGLITWDVFEGYVNKWKDQLLDNIKVEPFVLFRYR